MENGEDLDSIPESMRKYLALQAFETGKPFPTDIVQTGPMGLYGDGMLVPSGATPKVGKDSSSTASAQFLFLTRRPL